MRVRNCVCICVPLRKLQISGFTINGAATATCRGGTWYPPLGACNAGAGTNPLTGGGLGGLGGIGTTASVCPFPLAAPLGGSIQYSGVTQTGPFQQGKVFFE